MILYVMTRLMWTRTRWTGSGQMSCTLRATAASTTLPVLSFVGKADVLSPEVAAKRKLLRKVGAITQRIVRERVAPLVRARYPQLCGRSAARACTLCQSLIRRYLPDGRRSHGLHFDLQSAVTVVGPWKCAGVSGSSVPSTLLARAKDGEDGTCVSIQLVRIKEQPTPVAAYSIAGGSLQ